MAPDTYLRKTADISNPDDIYGKVPKEVDDLRSFWSQGVEQNEGCHNGRDQLVK